MGQGAQWSGPVIQIGAGPMVHGPSRGWTGPDQWSSDLGLVQDHLWGLVRTNSPLSGPGPLGALGWDEHTVITLNILIQYPASTLIGAICHPNTTYVNALGL